MGVPVINTEEFSDPNQQEICNGMFFKSMEELLPIIEREGIRVKCQSHPYDFVRLNDEACDITLSPSVPRTWATFAIRPSTIRGKTFATC